MADKKCPNCGRETREDASFCLGCGHSFGAAVQPRAAPESRPAPEREPPAHYEPQRQTDPAEAYVPPPPASGKRLTIDQRRDVARRRLARSEAGERPERKSAWRRFRPRRIELAIAAAMLPTTVLLALLAGIFISNVVDWLKQDEGIEDVEFLAPADFDAGRRLTVGMTQATIDSTRFEGVAGWRVVYLEETPAGDAALSAGDVHLATRDASPVTSPYYVMIAFPVSGTGAVPVAAFLRREDKTVFHVMGIRCDDALALLADTTRRGPPPHSTC